MPRRFLKRLLPDPKIITENKTLQLFGKILHDPNLWHLNRRSVARAFGIGFFVAFIPMPFQMVAAAALAILFHANILISVVGVWISNPITMPPMFYFAYKLGARILDIKPKPIQFELTIHWFTTKLGEIWAPLYLGSFICAIISGILAYFGVILLWRLMVVMKRSKKNNRKT